MMIYKQIVEKTEGNNGPEIRSDAVTNGGTAPVGLMRHNMFRWILDAEQITFMDVLDSRYESKCHQYHKSSIFE